MCHNVVHRVPRRFGLAGFVIDADITRINELLNPRSTLLRALTHQPAVQTHRQWLGIGQRDKSAFPFPKGMVQISFHGAARRIHKIGQS